MTEERTEERSLPRAALDALEVGDFPMMRRMLIGIKERAERLARERWPRVS